MNNWLQTKPEVRSTHDAKLETPNVNSKLWGALQSKRNEAMSNQDRRIISRRDLLKLLGKTSAGVYIAAVVPGTFLDQGDGSIAFAQTDELPEAIGYLLVDQKKCQGCVSCMLACSLVHKGEENLSLSRIQIIQDPFAKFPDDIQIAQCRQCTDPLCLQSCPVEAIYFDKDNGNVRTVDEKKCIGCMDCLDACPFSPVRVQFNSDTKTAQKCDLCSHAPYHWDEKGGGPDGKQACLAVCPLGAISFTTTVPEQDGDEGYNINLRGEDWKKLRFPIV